MAETLSGGQTVKVKPQPDIYTVLLIVTIVCLVVTIVMVLRTLMSPVVAADGSAGGYGMSLTDLFKSLEDLISSK